MTTFLDVLTSYAPLLTVFLTILVAKRAYAPVRRGPATTLHNYVIECSSSKPISPWIYKNVNPFTLLKLKIYDKKKSTLVTHYFNVGLFLPLNFFFV